MITATELQELSRQVENANIARALAVKELVKETRDRQFHCGRYLLVSSERHRREKS